MNREVQALVLALLGAATLRISLTDVFLSYVREPMRPLLIASGVMLLGLAAWSVWRIANEPEGGDGHGHHGPGTAWLLLLPVLAIFLVAPPPLGVEAAARDTGVIVAEPAPWTDLSPGDPVEIRLAEFAARSYSEAGRVTLQDRRVLLVGFVSPAEGGGWYLTRFVAACCAADAVAVKVEVLGSANPGDGQWVEVVGTYRDAGDTVDGSDEVLIPRLEAEQVTAVEQPRLPYL